MIVADAFTDQNVTALGNLAGSMQGDLSRYIWACVPVIGALLVLVVGISYVISLFIFVPKKL